MSGETRSQEKAAVAAVWRPRVAVGERWAVLNSKWFAQWCAYAGFDPDKCRGRDEAKTTREEDEVEAKMAAMSVEENDAPQPAEIDNTSLHVEGFPSALRRDIVEHEHFALVHEDVWKLLHSWYGGGPEFIRGVITVGLRAVPKVDLYPQHVKLVTLNDDGEPDYSTAQQRTFSASTSFGKIAKSLDRLAKRAAGIEVFSDDEDGDGFAPAGRTRKKHGRQKDTRLVRLWMRDPADRAGGSNSASNDSDSKQDDSKAEKKFKLLKGPLLEQPLQTFDLDVEEELWVEQRESVDAEWKRSAVKKNFRDFVVGDIVDCKDSVDDWYESTVRDVKPDRVLIHFNGWPTKWDEWIPRDSERIDMQNSHTTGPYVSKSVQRSGGYGFRQTETGRPVERGAVGLHNLGNTCFMNSTLQCLSNSPVLTEFFVEDKYITKINRDNPLGWHGRIADEYGALLKQLWSGKYRVVSPDKFKRVLGEFQPRFSGYQQQDSSELLSFLLDGLHEDLNQVRKKPATQSVESDGRPDAEVALEAWNVHLKRNQSIIVDSLQGQLKSKLVCPECDRVSITFDPFMYLGVPLPTVKDRVQLVKYVPVDPSKPITQYGPKVSKHGRIRELKESLAALTGEDTATMLVADVYNNKIFAFLYDNESVSKIRPSDDIYVFEVPELAESGDVELTLIRCMHHRYSPEERRVSKTPIGLPSVVAIPRREDISTTEIHRRIHRAVARYRRDERGPAKLGTKRAGAEDGDGGDDHDQEQENQEADGAADNDNNNKNKNTDLDPVVGGDEDYSYCPYVVTTVNAKGTGCSKCPASRRCRGCALTTDDIMVRIGVGKLSFGIWWKEDGGTYKYEPRETVVHKSAEKRQGRRGDGISLHQCIQEFTAEEVLSEQDPWYCSKCKKFQRATKKFDLWRLPDLLIVHLKRFSYTRVFRDKITHLVDFPIEGLDLSEHCVNSAEAGKAVYDLYAVSNHMGNLGGGHYTAYCKNLINGKWYLHDDSHVREASQDEVVSSSAYVLFYRRRHIKNYD